MKAELVLAQVRLWWGGGSRLSLVKQWPLRPISISHPLLIVNSVSPGLLSFMEMFGLEWMVELQ